MITCEETNHVLSITLCTSCYHMINSSDIKVNILMPTCHFEMDSRLPASLVHSVVAEAEVHKKLPKYSLDKILGDFGMEPPSKRVKGKEPKYNLEIPSSSMYNQIKEPVNVSTMLDPFPIQDGGDQSDCTGMNQLEQKNLQDTLEQIEQDVTTIKSSIVQKKPKMTLHQLNVKLDTIISILNKWDI